VETAGVSARGSLNRSDFGLKTFIPDIGDEIDLIIESEVTRQESPLLAESIRLNRMARGKNRHHLCFSERQHWAFVAVRNFCSK
jgi:hypothetical protein